MTSVAFYKFREFEGFGARSLTLIKYLPKKGGRTCPEHSKFIPNM